MKRYTSKEITGTLLGICLINSPILYSQIEVGGQYRRDSPQGMRTGRYDAYDPGGHITGGIQAQTAAVVDQQLPQDLQNLLITHGRLLNEANVAASSNAQFNVMEGIKARLFSNAHQIAQIFTTNYNYLVGRRFEELFDQHITLGSDYINAVRARNQSLATQIFNQSIANGRMLAQFLSNVISSFSYEMSQRMWNEHVMIEAQQTDAYFQQDAARAIQLRDQSIIQLTEMGSQLMNAMTPQQQTGSQPSLNAIPQPLNTIPPQQQRGIQL